MRFWSFSNANLRISSKCVGPHKNYRVSRSQPGERFMRKEIYWMKGEWTSRDEHREFEIEHTLAQLSMSWVVGASALVVQCKNMGSSWLFLTLALYPQDDTGTLYELPSNVGVRFGDCSCHDRPNWRGDASQFQSWKVFWEGQKCAFEFLNWHLFEMTREILQNVCGAHSMLLISALR